MANKIRRYIRFSLKLPDKFGLEEFISGMQYWLKAFEERWKVMGYWDKSEGAWMIELFEEVEEKP